MMPAGRWVKGVISLVGELDMGSVLEFESALAEIMKEGSAEIILDCFGLSCIDSSGLAAPV